jgi:acetyl-CoA synthetase
MVYAATTFRHVFTYQPGEVYWCTADVGWVTGHTYLVYGPLLSGATALMFEGIPTYPKPDRYWDMIERHRVNIFYTSPTAIRSLMRETETWITRHKLTSLRILGTVGEPINPETWVWYFEKIGGGRCPVIDTWWQTETGGIMVTPLPYAMPLKPGSASLPFFGVKVNVLREDGKEAASNEGGFFVIEEPWPAMLRGVYGQPERVKETYFTKFPCHYLAGDGARRDENGFIWFLGRVDDVLKVSGHRLGTAELESAFVKNPNVVEAAVVGFPHPLKGEGIYAFLTLKEGVEPSRNLRRELVQHIAGEIGPIAKPDHILFTDALPKTRSGKIMRRILRKIAAGEVENLGDTTTLADPSVVEKLVQKSHEEE